ncbi:Protein ssh4 [Mycoemilia scoparia]|uniref:Protein ssh4 n=1 Tax=Mycoemilia scoparia TaxID=417184 RepID=A0A9W8A906_9FUNG|nr:Protein ssh4 [Mycoemilia scoparia]
MPGARLYPISITAIICTIIQTCIASPPRPGGSFSWNTPLIPPPHDDIDDGFEDFKDGVIIALAVIGGVFGVFLITLITYFCVQNASRLGDLSLSDVELSDEQIRRLLPDDNSRQNYEMAREFERQHPCGSISTNITPEQEVEIFEKGVDAWEFTVNLDVNALLQGKTEVLFMGGDNCVQTNLPIPKTNPVYYFEVKITEKPNDVNMWIGLATKPYPTWRMAGWNKHSVGYSVNNGIVNKSYQFTSIPVGEQCFAGDIVGIGYQPHSGYVWFTRNGRKFRTLLSGMMYDMFPTISSDGPSSFSANFGQRGFVFIEANVKRWGFAPIEGAQSPPPMYGMDEDTILLETGISSNHRPPLQNSSLIPTDDDVYPIAHDASFPEGAIGDQPGRSGNAPPNANGGRSIDENRNYPLPPDYTEEDPIAKELLEAGSTDLFDAHLHRDRYGKRAQTGHEHHHHHHQQQQQQQQQIQDESNVQAIETHVPASSDMGSDEASTLLPTNFSATESAASKNYNKPDGRGSSAER